MAIAIPKASHGPVAIDVPLFALYGEQRWPHEDDGLNVEMLGARSRLKHTWHIHPHRHPDLHQLMWIQGGGGVVHLEGREAVLDVPRLLGLPPGVVHGFQWNPDIKGFVLTASLRTLRERTPAENHNLFEQPFSLSPSLTMADNFAAAFEELFSEFIRHGPGRQAGLSASMLRIISLIARDTDLVLGEVEPVSVETQVVARFRELIETTYRTHLKLEDYCDQMGMTPSRLSRACRMVTGRSPFSLVHDRLILEAKRMLTYSSASVSEAGFALGFSDPAYFSRFFSRHVGMSPVEFRTSPRVGNLSELKAYQQG